MYASGKSTKKMALILTIDIAQFPGCPYSVCGIELEFKETKRCSKKWIVRE